MKVVGVDLAGVEKNKTGFAILSSNLHVTTLNLHSDREIVSTISDVKPILVAIDAPLGLPRGRCCLENGCSCAKFGLVRDAERELRKMGIKVFSCGLPSMRTLTMRGIRLYKTLTEAGFQVIETYPGAAQDILGMTRKGKGLSKLRKALVRYGIKGEVRKPGITHHELDAVTAALVGKLFLEGKTVAVGSQDEQQIVIPAPKKKKQD